MKTQITLFPDRIEAKIDGRSVHITKGQADFLSALAILRRNVTLEELYEFLWGGCAEGGPEWAANIIRVRVCQLRKKGFEIITRKCFGYALIL